MKLIGMLAAILSVAVWSGVASAQYRQTQQPTRQQQMRAQREVAQPVRITGQLTAIRTIQLRGDTNRHVLAKIRTDRGNVVVNLGTVQELRQTQLRRGQRINVLARPGRINNRPVLFANRIRIGDQTLAIAREVPLNIRTQQAQIQPQRQRTMQQRQAMQRQRFGQQQAQMARQRGRAISADQTLMVRGDVLETRQLTVRDHDHKHVLARVRLPQGQTIVADLGPAGALKTQVQQGQTIVLMGKAGRINNRPVLVAESVADLEKIDRAEDQANQADLAAERQQQRQERRQQQAQQQQERQQQQQQAQQQQREQQRQQQREQRQQQQEERQQQRQQAQERQQQH